MIVKTNYGGETKVEQNIGHYSFIGGVVIAVVLGLVPSATLGDSAGWLASVLVVLGLVVGFMNIGSKETKDFMLVATVLIIAAYAGGASAILGSVQVIGAYLTGIFSNILAFVIPATVVVGLKQVWALGQSEV